MSGSLSAEAAALADLAGAGPLLHVAEDDSRAEALAAFLRAVRPDIPVEVFPAWDCLPYDSASPSPGVMGRRMAVLRRLDEAGASGTVITSAAAALQRIPPARADARRELRVGTDLRPDDLQAFLLQSGYVLDERVDEPGEAAFRAEVVEVFAADSDQPHRITVDDGRIGAIRCYDPASQRSTEEVEALAIHPVTELPPDACAEAERGAEHHLATAWGELRTLFDLCARHRVAFSPAAATARREILARIGEAYEDRRLRSEAEPVPQPDALYITDRDFPGEILTPAKHLPVPFFATASRPQAQLASFLRGERDQGRRIALVAATERDLARLERAAERALGAKPERVADWDGVAGGAAQVSILAPLERGHVDPERGLAIVAAGDLLGSRAAEAGTGPGRAAALQPTSAELHIGDLVVHLDHGVGLLEGLETIEGGEALRLAYDGGQTLLTPAAEAGAIWRYGARESGVKLDRLGTGSWDRRRAKLAEALAETARALVAAAEERRARSAPKLTPPQAAYERFAARFPFRPTPDQQVAVREVLADLGSGRPMDRLVVGDVGFGKTEVALRAAAAVALAGRQVAIVAPTTVLARQHARTFARRFEGTGLDVAHLSRLVPAAETRRVRAGLADGSVRVVVGTHTLLGKAVAFQDLGLLVIDEEQRFGTAHKQRLRTLGQDLHVLSMTATPIPRTLQTALVGLRDLSTIATPPARRRPVRTFNAPFDPATIRQALLRERRRGGQSFVIVPRVEDIDTAAARIARIVPDLELRVAHGQMPPREIDEAMVGFAEGRGDVLLATSIVESGLDVPRANTMIVLHPERFGLAQLHQLRGRVGRGNLQAYCFLAPEPGHDLGEAALKRLGTLQALDRLGAGMAISAWDLELRGAGDLFGERQAGHVKLIGLALYQDLLASALRAARGEPVRGETALQIEIGGSLPADYIPEDEVRINLYHRLAHARDPAEVEAFADELEDRFGPPVPPAEELLRLARIRATGRALGLARISAGPDAVAVSFAERSRRGAGIQGGDRSPRAGPRLGRPAPDLPPRDGAGRGPHRPRAPAPRGAPLSGRQSPARRGSAHAAIRGRRAVEILRPLRRHRPEVRTAPRWPARRRGDLRRQVIAQQLGVPQVRLEPHVDEVAHHRDRPHHIVDRRVQPHPDQRAARHAKLMRLPDDPGRGQRGQRVADARHQPDQRVETEPDPGAGNPIPGIQKPREAVDPM